MKVDRKKTDRMKEDALYGMLCSRKRNVPVIGWNGYVLFLILGHLVAFQRWVFPQANGWSPYLIGLFGVLGSVLILVEWGESRRYLATLAEEDPVEWQLRLIPMRPGELLDALIRSTADRLKWYSYLFRSCGWWGIATSLQLAPDFSCFLIWCYAGFYNGYLTLNGKHAIRLSEAVFWKSRSMGFSSRLSRISASLILLSGALPFMVGPLVALGRSASKGGGNEFAWGVVVAGVIILAGTAILSYAWASDYLQSTGTPREYL